MTFMTHHNQAFMCSRNHINILANSGKKAMNIAGSWRQMTPRKIGALLWAMNAKAVAETFPGETLVEAKSLGGYHYEYTQERKPMEIIKFTVFYMNQASQSEEWKGSLEQSFCYELIAQCCQLMPEFHEIPWRP